MQRHILGNRSIVNAKMFCTSTAWLVIVIDCVSNRMTRSTNMLSIGFHSMTPLLRSLIKDDKLPFVGNQFCASVVGLAYFFFCRRLPMSVSLKRGTLIKLDESIDTIGQQCAQKVLLNKSRLCSKIVISVNQSSIVSNK